MIGKLRAWLMYPELRGLPLDSPELTLRRREVVKKNAAAYFAFAGWYRSLAVWHDRAPAGLRVELGSGGGFLDEFIPGLIKTDVVPLPFIHQVCSAEKLPFDNQSVGALFMVNVFHHITHVRAFLGEADRVLAPGGVVAMVEPAVTGFSRFVFRWLHHEPFEPEAPQWELPPAGRLSGGNDALPWIVFVRDRDQLLREYPGMELVQTKTHDVLVHLLSGGVTTRNLAPVGIIKALSRLEQRWPGLARAGLFMTVVLRKKPLR